MLYDFSRGKWRFYGEVAGERLADFIKVDVPGDSAVMIRITSLEESFTEKYAPLLILGVIVIVVAVVNAARVIRRVFR